MLVLTRKPNESIMIGDDVEVTVLSVMGEKVRIGIQAPADVAVYRTEIYLEIRREQGDGGQAAEVGSELSVAEAGAELREGSQELGHSESSGPGKD